MTKKTLSVSAIENGTVIDHIVTDQVLKIIQLLDLLSTSSEVTVGLNLQSKISNSKGIIKISGREISFEDSCCIAVFSPNASINVIKSYEVVKKYKVSLPETLQGTLICPNHRCITNNEPMSTFFYVSNMQKMVHLSCKYCEKTFPQNTMRLGSV